MSTIITINRFDGGKAQDIRQANPNQYSKSQHFDIRNLPNALTPLIDMEADDTGVTDNQLRSFVNGFALGRKSSASDNPKFFERSLITDSWSASPTGEGSAGTVQGHTLVTHNDTTSTDVRLYALRTSGSDMAFDRYVPNTDVYTNGYGTITNGASSYTGVIYPRPHIHSADGFLYAVTSNKLARISNAGTFRDISTSDSIILPPNRFGSSVTELGRYLAIATVDVFNSENSKVFLWDRDVSLTTFNEVLDWGAGRLLVLDNLNGYLVGISEVLNGVTPKIVIAVSNGGQPQIVKEILISNSTLGALKPFKAVAYNQLYFALLESSTSSITNCIYTVGINKLGEWYVSEAQLPNNGTAVSEINGFSIVANTLYVQYDGSGAIKRTNDSASYTAQSIYETAINPSMPSADKSKRKKLEAVRIGYKPLSGGTIVVKYKTEATSFTQIESYSTSATEAFFERVFDDDGKQFAEGREYQFQIISTGGAQINSLTYKYSSIKDQLE